ncbi:hypothetical protein ACROYT_G042559 [Oculina patagonica]
MGYVADETNSRKLVFLVSTSMHTLAPILLLIPRPSEPECQSYVVMETPEQPYNEAFYNKSDIRATKLLNQANTNHDHSFLNESKLVFPESSPQITSDDQVDFEQSQDLLNLFLILLVLFIVTEFIAAPTKNLADSALLENLDSESANYGKFRLWGNIGQILLYFIVSPVAKSNRVKVCNVIQDDYGLTMFPFAVTMVGAFLMGLNIDFKQDELRKTKRSGTTTREIQESSLKDVLFDFSNMAFIVIILYLGIVDGVFSNFMFWYLTDIDPSQATWVMGVAGATRNIAAAFAFGYSGSVIRKLGVIYTTNLSLVIYVAAFVIYGLLSNPWLAIIPEVMQYIAYGMSMPACIVYFKERSPKEYSATIQGIVYSCYLGIGFGLGTIIGGFLMDIIGGSWTFLVFGGVTVIMILFFLVSLGISKLLKRRENGKKERESVDYESS